MSAKKKPRIAFLIMMICLLPFAKLSADTNRPIQTSTLAYNSLARQLGWVPCPSNECGGYFLDQPFVYPVNVEKKSIVEITSNHGLIAQRGTSTLEGSVTITRAGQQITANKVFLYRDPKSFKLIAADLIGDVNLREPNTLIVAKQGHYNFETNAKSLSDIYYRTSLNGREVIGPTSVSELEMQRARKITNLTAWGEAAHVLQTEPRIYELNCASFSTCSPEDPAWQVRGSHIVLNKNTGRGYVTNARILVKNIPVFYFPYINFSIDHKRKSGFLWPTFGFINSSFGPYILTPFYWNLAPNYDTTITPGYLSNRGVQISDTFRYLTPNTGGDIYLSVLPGDRQFAILKEQYQNLYGTSKDDTIQAELNRLLNSSSTRKSFAWHNNTIFNEHWASHINYQYVGDDYYLQDFGSNLSEVTQNQLLQEGDITYKGQHWNFTTRLQTYQTLHPIVTDQKAVQNQYRRFPQLVLTGDYPDQPFGLEYFINTEATHFDIRNTPGTQQNLPIGNRLHAQPGVSLPLYWPYFYINPRVQLAMSDYQLYQINETHAPGGVHRTIPIFDVASGLYFNRDFSLFGHAYHQTLEPQAYYTYIPYRNQSSIPVFDTTLINLSYDQLFYYNRFSGIDRIGDANQMGLGIGSRLIDQQSGLEKARAGVGAVVYFANRIVTLCSGNACTDNPNNHNNYQRLSPISGTLSYNVNPVWAFSINSFLWDPVDKQLNSSILNLHYQTDPFHIINLGYSYVLNGEIQTGLITNSTQNNIKSTDISFAWPLTEKFNAVGRWTHDWGYNHLQNLITGLQYDTCCWAVRLVGGRVFVGLDKNYTENNRLLYQNLFYIQFSLKGLGNIGSGDPTELLGSINGYNTQFGQAF